MTKFSNLINHENVENPTKGNPSPKHSKDIIHRVDLFSKNLVFQHGPHHGLLELILVVPFVSLLNAQINAGDAFEFTISSSNLDNIDEAKIILI